MINKGINFEVKKTAKDLSITPLEGMWIANIIFIPISIILIVLALKNSRLPKITDYIKIKY